MPAAIRVRLNEQEDRIARSLNNQLACQLYTQLAGIKLQIKSGLKPNLMFFYSFVI